MDARQTLSHSIADSRGLQDRYQGQASDIRSTDFRDPSRGPLLPPAIRPAAMDAIGGAYDSRGSRPGFVETGATVRCQDGSLSYRGTDNRQVSSSEPMNQSQWSSGGGVQWSAPSRVMPNQSTGYNYQQGNTGYGQQVSV